MHEALTLSGFPGDYMDEQLMYHSKLVLLIWPIFLFINLVCLLFLSECGLSYFGISPDLYLYAFVIAVECHCFHLQSICDMPVLLLNALFHYVGCAFRYTLSRYLGCASSIDDYAKDGGPGVV